MSGSAGFHHQYWDPKNRDISVPENYSEVKRIRATISPDGTGTFNPNGQDIMFQLRDGAWYQWPFDKSPRIDITRWNGSLLTILNNGAKGRGSAVFMLENGRAQGRHPIEKISTGYAGATPDLAYLDGWVRHIEGYLKSQFGYEPPL